MWSRSKEKDTYKIIKIAGAVAFIPLVLLGGPLTGYIAGVYLSKKFFYGYYVLLISTIIGCVAGMAETFRIIRFIIRVDRG